MKIKRKPVSFFVVGLMAASACFFADAIPLVASPAGTADKKVIVYYFHGDMRCNTCLRLEELTKKAVRSAFKKELAESKIELKVINIDVKGNEHFTRDYDLKTRSVIISEVRGSKQVRWKSLPKIWDYHSDETLFMHYIKNEIQKYL